MNQVVILMVMEYLTIEILTQMVMELRILLKETMIMILMEYQTSSILTLITTAYLMR